MRLKKTRRGFKLAEFKDIYGEPCSLQESSLADKPAIWLGCEKEMIHPNTGESLGARMHLDKKLAKELIKHLSRFIETGCL